MHGKKSPELSINTAILSSEITDIQANNVSVIDTMEGNLELYPKQRLLQEDGFHLSELGGQMIADQVNEHITQARGETIATKEETHRETEETITIHESMVGQVIGKGGRTIKTLTETYKVGISIKDKNNTDDNSQTAVVYGEPDNVYKAIKHIEKIVKQKEENDKERQKRHQARSKLVCTHFKYGKGCRYGDLCEFRHSREGSDRADNNRERSEDSKPRSRSRTNSPSRRSRQRSPQRHRSRDRQERIDSPRRERSRRRPTAQPARQERQYKDRRDRSPEYDNRPSRQHYRTQSRTYNR